MKKLLFVVMACVLCIGLVGGAFAYFDDTETSYGNTFTAGTLDLKIDKNPAGGVEEWADDVDGIPNVNDLVGAAVDNLKPGDSADVIIGIKNDGTIDGIADIHFILVSDNENGIEEPEVGAVGENGEEPGELGSSICVAIDYNGVYLSGYDISDAKTLADISCTDIILGNLDAGAVAYISLHLWIPGAVGNKIQGDSCVVDVEFSLDQA
jgi:spore coat-associated protein N